MIQIISWRLDLGFHVSAMSTYDSQEVSKFFTGHQLQEKQLAEGDVLFWQGSAIDYVYFVQSGEIRSERYLMEGRELVFFKAKKGNILCEESLYFDKYLYTGVASENTTVVAIPHDVFRQVSADNQEFTKQIIRCMSRRYEESLMSREILMIKSAEHRLLAWLNYLMPTDDLSIDFSKKMGTIASEIGLTRESIYRAFKKLENNGKIKRNQGLISIINPQKKT